MTVFCVLQIFAFTLKTRSIRMAIWNTYFKQL